LVVLWPKKVAAGSIVEQLLERLSERRLSSTWAIEEPAQAAVLYSPGETPTVDLALGINSAADPADEVERGLGRFSAAGKSVVAIQAGAPLPRGSVERRLCQSGVRAVVGPATRGKASIVRPLPFGLWELVAHIKAPAPSRLNLFGRRPRDLFPAAGQSPSIASIDLARVGSTASRAWLEVERLVDEAAEACAHGGARNMSIAAIVAELSDSAATRPQRSILRMAA
jgi:hypothetical protein